MLLPNHKNEPVFLALDSSTSRASVTVAKANKILHSIFISRQKSHSEQMHSAIDQVLAKGFLNFKDINAVVVTHGPGSFTGLRVAGNIAKTFAYQLKIPLVSIGTLGVLAHAPLGSANDNKVQICAMINAFKQMVFISIFERDSNGEIEELIKPSVFTLKQLEELFIDPILCVGDAFDYYNQELSVNLKSKLLRDQGISDFPEPQSLVDIGYQKFIKNQTIDWNQFLPLYLKASEAEENLRKGLLHFRKLN
jgi:tRNA threonylcarbamoyl adenosine modification protein YeaZ